MAPKLTTPTGVTVQVDDKHADSLRKQGYKDHTPKKTTSARSQSKDS